MLEVLVNGCNGKMGKVVCELIKQNENLNVELNFKTMSDFDPLSIVQQTPELNKVFAQKIKAVR